MMKMAGIGGWLVNITAEVGHIGITATAWRASAVVARSPGVTSARGMPLLTVALALGKVGYYYMVPLRH